MKTLLLSLLLAAPALAQQVHVVDSADPGAHATVQAAVDAAADGDVVLVRQGLSGVYPGFTVDGKELVVSSDPVPFRAQIQYDVIVRNLVAGQEVVLRSLVIRGEDNVMGPPPQNGALQVLDCDGHVWVEWCDLIGGRGLCGVPCFNAAYPDPGAVVSNCRSVSFARCEMYGGMAQSVDFPTGGAPGLALDDGQASLWNCICVGGNAGHAFEGGASGGDGGDGVVVGSWQGTTGMLFVSDSILEGGNGGNGEFDFQTAQCGAGGRGGHGINVLAGGDCWILDCELHPGLPGFRCNDPGPPGMDVVGPSTTFPGNGRVFKLTSPVREQAPITFIFRGNPGDQIQLYVSPTVTALPDPALNGVLLPTLPARVLDLGVLPASGQLVFERAVGSISGAPFLHLYLQGVFTGTDGSVFAGGPSELLVLPPGT